MELNELKGLIEDQGKAFEAFKTAHDEQVAELKKKGSVDPLLTGRIEKVETSLDAAVEAKAKLEAGLEAERKEREALELRINREGIKGSPEAAARELEIKDFNLVLSGHNADRKRQFVEMDGAAIDAYKAAQDRYMREGKESLSPEEVKTLSVGNDADGGYFVTPDVTGRIVTKVYESSPIRQIASVQVISTDALEGIEDLGEAGAGYASERAQGSDSTTPQVGKWSIPVYWIDTEPKATQQLLDDSSVNIEAWLSGKVSDKFARFESAEFVTGATKIRGITSYDTAADSGSGVDWGKLGHVMSGASAAFATSNPADKIFDLIGALKNAYLPNARFLTSRAVITKIRQFKDSNGGYLWQPSLVLGTPETIAGHAVTRAEDMPALAADSLSLAFGDFAAGYQVVDRQGVRVMRDPYTAKPYVKFYTTKRVGGGVVNFEAIKVMKFNT